MQLTKNISLIEATKSQTAVRFGIQNIPNELQLLAMRTVAEAVFEPLRAALGGLPIHISSFFRCPVLNTKLGSTNRSFHVQGAAMDLDGDVYGHHRNSDIFYYILEHLPFTELIWEYGNQYEPAWVHVAYVPGDPRRMVKRAIRQNGKTKIVPFNPPLRHAA